MFGSLNSWRIASGSFDRIGYLLQLQAAGSNTVQWVAVSMVAFTSSTALIGMPTGSGGSFVNTAGRG